ncbi:citrate lyase holo-[acyl-carrier protein] synthase [Streptomyces sp. NPDC001922]|uniref:citrate lyase holo-[acyl-carrier protein] synthase n=1 Tax=Streptomyces sp. NPDC001922 TaxID=3364624 RepID=UPI003689F0B7
MPSPTPAGDPRPGTVPADLAGTVLAWRDRLDAEARAAHRPGHTTVAVSQRAPAGSFTPAEAERLHRAALDRLRPLLPPVPVQRTYPAPAGPVTLLVVAGGSHRAKIGCLRMEQHDTVGELTDADVVLPRTLGRADLGLPPRACLVCDEPAKRCIVLGRHPRALLLRTARSRYRRAFAVTDGWGRRPEGAHDAPSVPNPVPGTPPGPAQAFDAPRAPTSVPEALRGPDSVTDAPCGPHPAPSRTCDPYRSCT